MTLGEKIYAARKQMGWTQTRLADELGVSSEVVSKWEHDFYAPNEWNAEKLNELLGLDLMEDDGTPVNARLFDEVHMSAFLKGKFSTGNYPNALRALSFAKEKHAGQWRSPKSLRIPYTIHPLTMACHALAMGLEDDALIAAILLHDVCEDCGVPPEKLPVCDEVQEIVALVTKPVDKVKFSEEAYYSAIFENPKACLVKCIDRCNNVSGMTLGFTPARMKEYIAETETWYPDLLRVVKSVPEYNNAAWLLSYQIRSILQTAKKIS